MDGRAYALDFGAIMSVGAARGIDTALLADVLPAIEAIVVDAINGDDVSFEEEEVTNG